MVYSNMVSHSNNENDQKLDIDMLGIDIHHKQNEDEECNNT